MQRNVIVAVFIIYILWNTDAASDQLIGFITNETSITDSINSTYSAANKNNENRYNLSASFNFASITDLSNSTDSSEYLSSSAACCSKNSIANLEPLMLRIVRSSFNNKEDTKASFSEEEDSLNTTYSQDNMASTSTIDDTLNAANTINNLPNATFGHLRRFLIPALFGNRFSSAQGTPPHSTLSSKGNKNSKSLSTTEATESIDDIDFTFIPNIQTRDVFAKNNDLDTTITTDIANNETIITVVTTNVTIAVENGVTNITEITVVTNITSNTNSTKNKNTNDINDSITTVIFTNTTIVTVLIDRNDTTVTTKNLDSIDVIETKSMDDIINTTTLLYKNSSDITTRRSYVSNISPTTLTNSTDVKSRAAVDTTEIIKPFKKSYVHDSTESIEAMHSFDIKDTRNDFDSAGTTHSTAVCTAQGFFDDPYSTNCTSYYECIQNEDGSYVEIRYTCPENSYYDPDTSICDFDFECQSKSYNVDVSSFTCSSVGKFSNRDDTTCQTFFACTLLNNGAYDLHKFICPRDSVFDPTNKYCTRSNTCVT